MCVFPANGDDEGTDVAVDTPGEQDDDGADGAFLRGGGRMVSQDLSAQFLGGGRGRGARNARF